MTRRVTTLLALFVCFLFAGQALAQTEVTVREINAIPQDQVDALNALGDGVSSSDFNNCGSLIFNDLCGETVQFTAVVMTDPLSSGLSSVGDDGQPSRIHVFVRDTTAASEGPEGHGIQIVDGDDIGFDALLVGDVITVVGVVDPFFSTMQISPQSMSVVSTGQFSESDNLLAPIAVTTSDLNADVGDEGAIRVEWDNLADYRGNYVRFEGATALTRTASAGRVDWNWSSDDGATSVAMYDTSIRFRNDRNDYPDDFNVPTDDFEAPTPGATVNVQGFVTFNGQDSSDPFQLGVPNGAALAVNPWDDEDVEITQTPPKISHDRPSAVPSSTNGIALTAEVEADPSRTIATSSVVYTTTSNSTPQSVEGTSSGGTTFDYEIPSADLNDGDFLSYWFTAEDNTGATTESSSWPLRVLDGGITNISHIQETSDSGPGDSPFVGMTVDTDITATVQVDPTTEFIVLQDDDSQANWSGIAIEDVDRNSEFSALAAGDVINVTSVLVEEDFGVTKLHESDITFTVTSTGGDVIAPKVITTTALQDESVAEAHEGMMLQIDDPVVVDLMPDFGTFGEFVISSDGTVENGLRVDDLSATLTEPSDDSGDFDPSAVLAVGQRLEFVIGPLWYTFGNYKLEPVDIDALGPATNTATEDGTIPAQFTLRQNYPNPFNPSTQIEFDVSSSGQATLEVFDVLGRKVSTLLSEEVAVGSHTVTFNAANLPSGVYVYRLSAGANTETRKMLLMK